MSKIKEARSAMRRLLSAFPDSIGSRNNKDLRVIESFLDTVSDVTDVQRSAIAALERIASGADDVVVSGEMKLTKNFGLSGQEIGRALREPLGALPVASAVTAIPDGFEMTERAKTTGVGSDREPISYRSFIEAGWRLHQLVEHGFAKRDESKPIWHVPSGMRMNTKYLRPYYEMRALGWTDDDLIAAGHLVEI